MLYDSSRYRIDGVVAKTRRITREEYATAVRLALAAGLHRLYDSVRF